MNLLEVITNNTSQVTTITLDDGSFFTFKLEFSLLQYGWFIRELTYNDFVVRGIRVCNSYNLLHQFINLLPFGLACISKDGREPMLQDDFTEGNISLYVLTKEETTLLGKYIRGEV